MANYGNTWWGKKLLDALSAMDNSGRLARGKTYANKGAVLDIAFTPQNKIEAKVQGSQRRPYKINIGIQPLSILEKEDILHIIVDNPFLLTSLLSKELPAEILEEMDKKSIRLFPRRWSDWKTECSCPDYAVPCKHIAAVLYRLANEVDKNPFLLFQLRDFDILQELFKRGYTSKEGIKSPIPNFEDMIIEKQENFELQENLFHETIQMVDFSQIKPSTSSLLQLLEDKPNFYIGKNFKTNLEKAYNNISKNILKYQPKDKEKQNIKPQIEKIGFIFNVKFKLAGLTLDYTHNKFEVLDKKNFFEDFIDDLENLNRIHLLNLNIEVQILYYIYQFAKHLAEKGAFIPQVIGFSEDTYQIRWIPALLIPEVQNIFQNLLKICSTDLVFFASAKNTRFARQEDNLMIVLSTFLNYFVQKFADSRAENDVDGYFFERDFIFVTKHYQDKETPFAIQKWLQKFFIAAKRFLPVLQIIEETEGGYYEEEKEFFKFNFLVQDTEKALDEPIPLKTIFKKEKYLDIQIEILQDLVLLQQYIPEIQTIIKSKGEKEVRFNIEYLTTIMLEILPVLRLLGIPILLPKALQRILKPQKSVRMTTKGSSGANSFLNMSSILDFQWQVALGDEQMNPKEFFKLVKGMKGLVKINNQYVYLDEKEMATLIKKLENPDPLSQRELLTMALAEDYEGAKILLDEKAKDLIKEITKIEEVKLPENLQAQLRPYQLRGYEWLYKNSKLGFGSLLADDMGLGKTLQVITFLLKYKQEGKLAKNPALIVLPTTLITNWQKEITKFAPDLTMHVYHGSKRNLITENIDVVLTSYGTARSDVAILNKIHWAVLGIDEAQNIKNTNTEQTKALKKIKANTLIAMSGTPVENRLAEYWSIFDFANKGYLDSLKNFLNSYIKPIELDRNQEVLDNFKKITAPFILRRVKTDKSIISDLPDKIETDTICTLTPEQTALYQNMVEASLKAIQAEDPEKEGFKRAGLIFTMMLSLKQICNHPSNFLKKDNIDPTLSGKTQVLLELLDSILEVGEKTLIFTQYKEMGDLLVKLIKETYHFEPLWLHGGVSRENRDKMVEAFQHKNNEKIMILSLKAGGTGLNLTQANHVIHYDLWWNPAVESQATDRAFRIGQKKNVMVYRFITQATFEEKINAMIQNKKDLANLTVTSGENWIGDFNNDELKEIFRLK